MKPAQELYEQLKEMCANILSKNKFSNTSGIVIAGFGEREVFPSYVSFTIEAVINNRLKYGEDSYIKIDHKRDKFINVFAQGNIIEAFMLGRDPQYDQIINGYLRNLLTNVYPKAIIDLISDLEEPKKAKLRETLESAGKTLYDDFINKSEAHCRENYFGPIYEALTSLPKDELATVAESLVNLTSFKKRMSLDAETVGGPCDVAVISKGDGFIWIKRKYYFKQEMNPQFFTNYYKKGRLSSGGE